MQWYLTSLVMLIVLVGAGALTGALVIAFLPRRMLPGARVFLSVPLGWAVLTLVATLLGWLGHGFAGWHCAAITALLSAAGAWTGRAWLRQSGGDALRLAAFCLVASFPVLGSLWLHGTFNAYNDTFIYICHGQWLQGHGFLETARTDGGHPAWGTVVYLRDAHLRMGTSFLLGWVQAMFGREWSYEVFPLVSALGVICGALGIGATVLAACPGRWLEAWLAAMATAVTANGFVFGATNGFLPQTWGLAFVAAAVGLRGLEPGTRAQAGSGAAWKTGVPFGICVAAMVQCYWDLLPLAGPALASAYLIPWPGHSAPAWRVVWARVWPPALTCLLLANVEWLHAVPGLVGNVSAVVANPVAWHIWDFPAHALGLKSSVWENGQWITQDPGKFVLIWGCAAVLGWLALLAASLSRRRLRRWLQTPGESPKWRVGPLVPVIVWLGLTALLIIHFRYFVASPWREYNETRWPDGIGQSWSQYKLTIWASASMICLVIALGTGWTMRKASGLRRRCLIVVLVFWCGTGSGWNYVLAWRHGKWMLQDADVRRDPFAVCLAMRQRVSALPPNDWIYLEWPENSPVKFRELMVYFLSDRSLASNWSNDGYLAYHITEDDGRRTAADCQWVLRYRPPASGQASAGDQPSIGGMTLEKRVP